MNRSTRNIKIPRVDSSIPVPVASSVDSDTPTAATGRDSGLSPILPRPTTVSPRPVDDFFPELQHINGEFSANSSSAAVAAELLLPDPLPPLPPSITKPYNTRKRTAQVAQVNSDSTTSPSATTASSASNKPIVIPGFVSKLYRMVDESTSNLIKWGADGITFVVTSPEDFSRQVLPLFFKHNNFSSFVRQLNMYGFHKVPHLQQGTMAASAIGNNESTSWEFSHVSFIRNRPDLLINVRRKIGKEEGNGSCEISPTLSSSSALSETNRISTSDDFLTTAKSLRQELQFIHQQQNALRTDLMSLQRDNQLLWNENLASRERHLQQQQVIDRILRFLASVFTTDGKLLTSANIAGLNANNLSALQSNLAGSPSLASHNSKQQRQLLLGNIADNDEEELRRQVLELISVDENKKSSVDLVKDSSIDFSHKFQDLDSTTRDISNDISVVEDQLSNVLKNNSKNESETGFDDLDFSSYLNCQSLE